MPHCNCRCNGTPLGIEIWSCNSRAERRFFLWEVRQLGSGIANCQQLQFCNFGTQKHVENSFGHHPGDNRRTAVPGREDGDPRASTCVLFWGAFFVL